MRTAPENHKMKKKILFAITKSNWGGAQRYVFDLATGISADEYDVAVMLGGAGALARKLSDAGIRVITIDGLGRDIKILSEIGVFLRILFAIKKESPDIIHINSSKMGGMGALAGRMARVPRIVFTAHGWPFNEKRGALSRALRFFGSWVTALLSHHIIAVSRYDTSQALRMPLVKNKISLIWNGISDIAQKKRADARALVVGNTALSPETLIIGCVGELHTNKGYEYAVRAMSIAINRQRPDSPPLVLVIIGEGEERARLESLIAREGLRDSILLVGQRDNAGTLCSAFDIFMLPSVKEGLPYVLLEAGNAGLPIIASETGGVPEVIKDMTSGILVQPANPDELAEAILFFVEHPEKRKMFGAEAKKTVQEMFSLNDMREKTMHVYNSRA